MNGLKYKKAMLQRVIKNNNLNKTSCLQAMMKRLIMRMLFVFVLTLFLIACVTQLNKIPSSSPDKILSEEIVYVLPKASLGDACGFKTWEEGKEYSLLSDLKIETDGPCISPDKNNIVINCNGHSIIGNNQRKSFGININSVSRIVMKNCNIKGFSRADKIGDIGFFGPTSKGIFVNNATNISIMNSTISDCFYGIHSEPSSWLYIKDVEITDCDYGIYLFEVSNSTFKNIIITKSRHTGMHISGGGYPSNNLFENMTISENSIGIKVVRTSDNIFNEIKVCRNTLVNVVDWSINDVIKNEC